MGLVLNFQISSIIHPFFLYCLPIFGATYEVHLKPLFMLQKKAIRIINGASYLQHTDPLFYSSKILKIRDQYKLSIGTYPILYFSVFVCLFVTVFLGNR